MFDRELEVAITAARMAGRVIMEVYREAFSVETKADASPVTEADTRANTVILSALHSQFPDDGYLSEESEDDDSRFQKARFWVIDPLDGTKEFIKQNGEFAVSIGLVDAEGVALGVVYGPVEDVLYYAVRGAGAYKEVRGCRTRIRVSDREKPFLLLVSRSRPPQKTILLLDAYSEWIETVTPMGSALKGCLIAEGAHDVYYNFGRSMKWDTCGMECIVREAGGIMKRLDHEDIDYHERSVSNAGFYILNRSENRMDPLLD